MSGDDAGVGGLEMHSGIVADQMQAGLGPARAGRGAKVSGKGLTRTIRELEWRSRGCEEQWVTLMRWSGAEGTGHPPSSYHVTADFPQARRRPNMEPSARHSDLGITKPGNTSSASQGPACVGWSRWRRTPAGKTPLSTFLLRGNLRVLVHPPCARPLTPVF